MKLLDCAVASEQSISLNNHQIYSRTNMAPATDTVNKAKVRLKLKRYQAENLFTTYFPPEDFSVEENSSGEGNSVRFVANYGGKKVENAYVQFAFLNFCKTLGEMSSFINGKDGLIASNGWRVVARIDRVSYPWAKEKIVFSRSKDIVGEIYLGKSKGKVFYVITHFPVEYGDVLPTKADAILQNLQITASR
jgi:hypothetical protein